MKIIVVRHASTVFNEKHLINGQQDDPLSAEGLNELPELVKKLESYDFTIIYSSPLKRALDTAGAISKARGMDINVDPRLSEVNFGSFTSKNWDSMKDAFGVDSRGLLNSYSYDLRPYGGESSDQVRARIQIFLNDLGRHPDQTPLLATHNGIIRWLDLLCSGQKTSGLANSEVRILDLNAQAL